LRLSRGRTPAVSLRRLLEQAQARFPVFTRPLFAWRNDANHFAADLSLP